MESEGCAELLLDKMAGAVLYGVKTDPGSGDTGPRGAGSERYRRREEYRMEKDDD